MKVQAGHKAKCMVKTLYLNPLFGVPFSATLKFGTNQIMIQQGL